ncbi:MAG: PorT family protein [Prevotella sp.]|nr:PorT family protein [Prevotella sp.]
MKKIVFSVLLAIVAVMPSFAQYSGGSRATLDFFEDRYIGVRVGPSLSNLLGKGTDDLSTRIGLNIGAVVGFPLSDSTPLFFESGLLYTEKGCKYTKGGADEKTSLCYLELPVIFKYAYEIDDKLALQPFFGGYFSYGLGGKTKDFNEKTSEDSFGHPGFRRFDAGFKFGVGAQYDLFYMELGYDLGLANVGHDEYNSIRNGALTINFGVNF